MQPYFSHRFGGNVLLIPLMIGGITMPDVLMAYEFSHENPGRVILTESEILQGTVRTVKPPTFFGVDPAVGMCRREAGGFFLLGD